MTVQELIDQVSSSGELKNVSNDEIGKLINPESTQLTGFQKFLGNAAAFRGVFGQDSEKLGREVRQALTLNEVNAGLEAKRADQKKQKDIMSLFDLDKSGSVGAGELPQSQQSRLRSEGQFPP